MNKSQDTLKCQKQFFLALLFLLILIFVYYYFQQKEWFLVFLVLGIGMGLFYSAFGDDATEYNPDLGWYRIASLNEKGKIELNTDKENKIIPQVVDRRRMISGEIPPSAWKVERFIHRFMGVLLGWLIMWFLLDKRLQAFSGFNNMSFGFSEIALLILGYIGINGRLPTIAHSVQEWFRRS